MAIDSNTFFISGDFPLVLLLKYDGLLSFSEWLGRDGQVLRCWLGKPGKQRVYKNTSDE